MTTYVATITHDDDGDLHVKIEGVGSSPDDRASIAWALRTAAADLVEHGEVVEKVTFN